MASGSIQGGITIERRLDVAPADVTEEWFRSYVTELGKYTDDPEDVSCEVSLRPNTDNRVEFRNRKAWIDYVLANWNDVIESDIWQQSDSAVSRARYHHRRHQVFLRIKAETISDAEQIVKQLSGALSLVISPAVPIGIAIERRFDVALPGVTEAWFRSYVNELAKYTSDPEDVSCEVRLHPDRDNCVKFRNRKVWTDYILANWNAVGETSIWQNSPGSVSRASCHHRRHHLILSISGRTISVAEQIVKQLSSALSAGASPDLPYKYRRLSLEFEIGNWRQDLFVIGVKNIAALLGSDPEIPEAYAKALDENIEKLTSFFDLKSFCEKIGTRVSLFGEIVITMYARSISVGIAVPSDHKKLRIRTSLPPDPDMLDKLTTAWPDELKLKQIKAADVGAGAAGAAPAPSENPWLKYGIPVLTALIAAASTAGLVSFTKALRPDYKVVISSPPVEKGVAKWLGNDVSISWYLQPDQTSFMPARKDVVATVRVTTQPPKVSKPPVSFSLQPGTYIVSVDAEEAIPATFQLIVEKNP